MGIKDFVRPAPPSVSPRIAADIAAQRKYVLQMILLTVIAVPIIDLALRIVWETIFLPIWMLAALVLFIWCKAILSEESFLFTLREYVTLIPVHYAEGELRVGRGLRATHVLVLVNLGIHFTLGMLNAPRREAILEALVCVPMKLELWNALLSPLTSMFLHADVEHLLWNMLFLWIFGLVLERRIGWQRFVLLYLSTGVIATIFSVAAHMVFLGEVARGLGASGAISGIMGVFAVRLYYKRLVFPIPVFVVPLWLKVRMNSLMVIGMYLILDLEGGFATLLGEQTGIDYLAHIGGTAAGIVLALRLRLQDRAMEEMHVEKALANMEGGVDPSQAEISLRLALERNPENETALLALARRRSKPRPSDEGRRLYQKLIRTNLDTVPERAAETFAEYFPIYRIPLDPAAQYRLTGLLRRSRRLDLAARALEPIADDPAAPRRWAERILFKLAGLLEELRLPEAARFRYEQLLDKFPDFHKRSLVEHKIKILTGG